MKIFKLYSNCIPVKGFTKSIICDLQNGKYKSIPNDLYSILTDKNLIVWDVLIEQYGQANEQTLIDYFNFLIKNNFGFWCDKEVYYNFPDFNLDYSSDSIIENAIIDFNSDTFSRITITHYEKVINDLEYLGCKAIMLRFFSESLNDDVEKILSLFVGSRINHISLLIKCSDISNEVLCEFFNNYPRVFDVTIHSSTNNDEYYSDRQKLSIIRTTQKINNSMHCGFIHPMLFNVNLKLFTESIKYNNCLNRKISIDENGNIKNCPTLSITFGNILMDTLIHVVENEKFKLLWNISKNLIKECMVCEYRYICQDCRANLPNDSLLKPTKCKYNPYDGTWNI